jgi:CHAT domain/Tetratricopeptide Repeats-Sensor/Lecithin:cholesterol acyltransferase
VATLLVPGIPDPQPERSDLARALPPGMVEAKHAARVDAARAVGGQLRLEGLQPDDVVEIELEDGLRLWSRVDDLERDLGLTRARGGADQTIALPGTLPIGGPSRGWAGWAIKGLKVLGINVEKAIGDFVADHVEGRLQPGPGLYRCSDTDVANLTPVQRLEGSGPTLVFLHGTASSTAGSFGGLWIGGQAAPIRRVFDYYKGRVLALQHETLTKSPIENASVVAQHLQTLLDRGTEIHLVSHSRGGLVGELLARGMRMGSAPFTPDEITLFDEPARRRDYNALRDLNQTLQDAQFRVTRFVRVACPVRGTMLADRRLDRYFSILVNLVGWIPGLKGNPIYDGLTSLLAGVLKQRTKPEDLPGLEAQMPGSPLVLLLNRPGVRTEADLHVLGGDLVGAGVLGRLKTFATDLYYGEDHDLVVNTPSMLGGADRARGVRYWIDTGSEVTHFHYFSRPDTAGRLVAALTDGRADFHVLEAQPFAVTADDYRKRAPVPQPVVFVLPGIMGSELSIDDAAIWMNIFALAVGGLARLRSDTKARASGLIRSAYGALCTYLAATHEVVPFPYDWRISIKDSALALRQALDDKLLQAEAQGQPIRILAHSMGGLVVRAMLATPDGQQTWSRICKHPGARFIMLGTPNGGTHAIPAILIGRDALVKKLALLDLKHDYAGLLATITAFQGVLDLLPDTGSLDLFDPAQWQALYDQDAPPDRGLFSSSVASSKSAGFAWPVPSAAALAQARAVRDMVATSAVDPTRMVYVAGVADETACDILVEPTAAPGRRVRVLASAHGDGRVLWRTGIPAGLRVFYMDAVHGDLASTQEAFPALLDLLTTGTTSKLPTTAPQRRAAATETFEMREPLPSMLPDQEDLVASALGGRRRPMRRTAPRHQVRVRVMHDDLSNARSPVLIGHYEQDLIVGAESYLDRQLRGRLTELSQMELYPGPIGIAVAVLNSESALPGQHPGAVVAGLGKVGDLTPGRLTATLAQALTVYGAESVGQERRRRQRDNRVDQPTATISAPITALLVGSGEAGVSLSDSLQALLRAVAHANARLHTAEDGGARSAGEALSLHACIDRIDIIELYEDRAIEAVHALLNLARSAELPDFTIDELLIPGSGGQRRARFEVAQEWWQRIRVTVEDDDGLRFEALTQLARVPASLRPTQRRVVDTFLKRVTATAAFDPELGPTLFEMLVPNAFKSYAPDRRNLVLMLDPRAAAIPWELLHDRYGRGSRPLAVASGMVRQLLVDTVQSHVVRAPGATALVIGNPPVSDQRFPSLPGAAAEANVVAERLARDYEVVSLVGAVATPMAVLSALYAKPWRIVHLAAHGVFQFTPAPGEPPVSGLVLDDGVFITAADAVQMRHVPDLVFINCCHLGQTRGEAPLLTAFNELAANLGTEFIEMGVRAVVAAGWAVDDAAANTFARTFYERMLAGSPFGDAVALARQRVFEDHGATNTWGAYQCYGDPGFALVTASDRVRREAPVSDLEVVIQAEQIERAARMADARQCQDLFQELEALVGTVPEVWWRSSALCAAVAAAYGELDHFEAAIRYYERVTTAERAGAPVRALEQLANLRVRWARTLAGKDARALSEALGELESAERLLRGLLAVGKTAERYNLLGSLQKRRAMLTEGEQRRRALEEMRRAYAAAFDIAGKTSPARGAYPLANRLAAEVVQSWQPTGSNKGRSRAAAALDEGLTLLDAVATELSQSSTDFFDLSARADHTLLSALKSRTFDPLNCQDVVVAYVRAGLRGISPRHRASMRDQVAFFEAMAQSELIGPESEKLASELGLLGQALS